MAAVLGGTNSLHTDAMDEALALPSDKAATLALRTQQVILHESGAANTVDPLGGSWFIERLTNDIEADAEAYFERIERLGGVIPAIESGYFHREIMESSQRYQREVERGERIVVGVNAYQSEALHEVPLLKMDIEGRDRHMARLAAWKSTRDQVACDTALSRLESASKTADQNTMPLVIDAVRAGATVGEVCAVWRKVFGEYREVMAV